MATRQIVVPLKGDEKDLVRAFKKSEAASVKFGKNIGRLGKGMGTFGSQMANAGLKVAKFGALAGAAMGVAAVKLGQATFNMARDLEAMQGKAEVVFGKSLGQIERWADESAAAMGLSSNQAVGLATDMADLLKPMGFTSAAAAGMSSEMVGLAGALSEWSKGQFTATEAANDLAKGLLGETEGLKKYGIGIKQNDLKVRLAAKGQAELTGQALKVASALALQELILEATTDAQQGFADGSDSLGRKQAELAAGWTTLKEAAAEAALPLLQIIVPAIADELVPWLATGAEKVKEFGEGLKAAFDLFADPVGLTVNTELGPLPGLFGRDELGGLVQLESRNEQFARSIDELFGDTGVARGPIAGFLDFLETVPEKVDTAVNEISEFFASPEVASNAEEFDELLTNSSNLLDSLFKARPDGDDKDWLATYMDNQAGILEGFNTVMSKDWNQLWEDIKESAAQGWDEIIVRSFNAQLEIFNILEDTIRGMLEATWKKLTEWGESVTEWFNNLISKISFGGLFDGLTGGPGFGGGGGSRRGSAAGGPVTESGLRLVGEQGPERVFLPAGSTVQPAHQVAAPDTGSGGTVINVTVNGSVMSERDLADVVTDALRRGYVGLGVS